MDLYEQLEEEISKSHSKKPIRIKAVKIYDGFYAAKLPFKIEGEMLLESEGIEPSMVVVQYHAQKKELSFALNAQEDELTCYLRKDNSALLKALKNAMQRDTLACEPAFIVGPPGTGKTKVIKAILQKGVDADLKVGIFSPTNMAVENVLERLKPYPPQTVVSTIKSDVEVVKSLSPESIKENKLTPLLDELEVVKEIKNDLLRHKRDKQPQLLAASASNEADAIAQQNLNKEIVALTQQLKEEELAAENTAKRIEMLKSNLFLRSLSTLVNYKKVDELKMTHQIQTTNSSRFKQELEVLETRLDACETSLEASTGAFDALKYEMADIDATLLKVRKRIREISKEAEQVRAMDFIGGANVVAATLANAALNKHIQGAGFDMIIVDEASMALMPSLVVASQALNDTPVAVEYAEDEQLNQCQNEAVRLALQHKFICVGDPKQLAPIAQVQELKRSVFEHYDMNRIFDGEKVENSIMLDTNYRCPGDVVQLSSNLFYGGLLKGHKQLDRPSIYLLHNSSRAVMDHDGSFVNNGTMHSVTHQVNRALERGRRSIGVITPFRAQAERIAEQLKDLETQYADADIQVGTVHKFQGKEKEVIIFDITASPGINGKIPRSLAGSIESSTAKLLNVALTRAEDFFIIIGDINGFLALDDDYVIKQWLQAIEAL